MKKISTLLAALLLSACAIYPPDQIPEDRLHTVTVDVSLNYKTTWANIQRGARANRDNWSASNIDSEDAPLIDGLLTIAPNYTVAKIIIKGDGANNTHLTVKTFRPTVDLGGSVCNAKLIQLWANGDVKNDGAGLPEC